MRLGMLMEAFCCCFEMGGVSCNLCWPSIHHMSLHPEALLTLFILKQSLTKLPKLAWIDDPPVSASRISRMTAFATRPCCCLCFGNMKKLHPETTSDSSASTTQGLELQAGKSSRMWPCTLGLTDTFNMNFSFQNKLWQVLVIWCGSNSQEQNVHA